jgi:hypothetical protein
MSMPVRHFFRNKPTVLPEAQPGLQLARQPFRFESEAGVKTGAYLKFEPLTHLALKSTDAFRVYG